MTEWGLNNQKPVVVLRFLGTSPKSSTIISTLQSVCHQLAVNLNMKDFVTPEDANETIRCLNELLTKATKERPFYIFLDSLDQLSAKNNAYSVGWLPRTLPEHAHILVSSLPDLHGILDNLRNKLPEDQFYNVVPLGHDLSQNVLASWLGNAKRTLTSQQMEFTKSAFKTCSLPLYVKLVYDQVLTWKSYDLGNYNTLSGTVRSVINDLFAKLETKHGKIFVSHALAYITASRSGLSESEWEDVLSLDDTVLEDVFQYHVPPVRRAPQILIIRLLHEISQYIVAREADSRRVLYWYHRQFIEAAQERFLSQLKLTIHSHLAEYYSGTWNKVKKPFAYNAYHMKKLGLKSPNGEADRLIPAQPLVFEESGFNDNKVYNLRKLNSLPWHLFQSEKVQELHDTCYFDLDFLQCKLEACGVHSIISDLSMKQKPAQEVQLLKKAISETRASLNKKPSSLPVELSGRLLPFGEDYGCIKKLLKQCYEKSPLLPLAPCYPIPGGSGGVLIQTLEHKDLPLKSMDKCLFVTNHGKTLLALSERNEIIVWDIETGDVEREIPLWPNKNDKLCFNTMKMSSNGEFLLAMDAFQKEGNPFVIYDIKNDDVIFDKMLETSYKKHVGFVDHFQFDASQHHIIINVKDREGHLYDINGNVLYHFQQPITIMEIDKVGKQLFIVEKDQAELKVFSLENNEFLNTTIKTIAVPSFLQHTRDGKTVFVGYKSLAKAESIEIHLCQDPVKLSQALQAKFGQN